MDISRLGTFLFLMILRCGDIEPNPGPAQESSAKSEVLRRFTRCIQSELVKLIYNAKNKEIPNPNNLYENDPPGWNSFKVDIKFESVQKGRSQSFDKLVELFKREVRKMPKDIADVLNCYEKLNHSNRKTDEMEKLKFKTALENYVSRNRALKNRQTVLDNLDEELLIKALQKATEMAKLGSLASSPDGLDNVLDAINNFVDAVEHVHAELLLPNSGRKRSLTSDKIQQVKKRRTLAQCRFKGKEKIQTSKGKQSTGKIRNAKKSPRISDPSQEAWEPINTTLFYEEVHSRVDMSEIEQCQETSQDYFGLLESPPHHQGIQDDDFLEIPDIGAYTEILTEASQDGNSSDNLDLDTIQEPIFNQHFVNQTVFDIPVDETNYFSPTFVSVADFTQAVNIPTTVSSLLTPVEPTVPTLDMEKRAYQSFQDGNTISEDIMRFISSLSNTDLSVENNT